MLGLRGNLLLVGEAGEAGSVEILTSSHAGRAQSAYEIAFYQVSETLAEGSSRLTDFRPM